MSIRLFNGKALLYGSLLTLLVFLVACGTTSTATPVPPTATTAPQPTESMEATATAMPTESMEATATPMPTAVAQPTEAPTGEVMSAKDKAVLVVGTEPEKLFWPQTADAHTTIVTEQMTYYIGHMDRDTLQVSPTSSIVSWEQTAPDEWVFHLRPGVTFQDGEKWNAEAWKTMAEFTGVPDYGVGAYAFTGPYTVEPVDDLTAKIHCGEPCPLFDRSLSQNQTVSPKPFREQDIREITYAPGAGPFKLDDWQRGTKILMSSFDGYVAPPETPEYAAPKLKNLEFQWRGETTVREAMIETGEADWAFLLTLDDAERLGPDRFVTGGTAEIAQFRIDTIWDPWLKQLKMRQAVVHAINCQEIVDSLYQGATTCRGNTGAPGVLGINESNIAPYEYDPTLSESLLEEIGYICDKPNSAPNCGAEITITSRADRVAKNQELVEAMVGYMNEVGINAKAQFVEVSTRTAMAFCGIGTEGSGATQVGWQGATEATPPACEGGVGTGQILDGLGFGYETLDYGKFITRHLMCESSRSTVCDPAMESKLKDALGLAGDERKATMEEIAQWSHDNIYILPMFDLFAIYGINPKLRGFEEPRFDKHTFSGLWWFEE